MMTKFNVGDKVRITKDLYPHLLGKEGVIMEDDGTNVAPYIVRIEDGSIQRKFGKFLELVTPSAPKKSERITALETQVAELKAKVEALESAQKYPLTAKFERESAEVDEILADIGRKAKPTLEALLATYPTQNEQRADVIKRAKAYLEEAKKDTSYGRGLAYIYDNVLCDVEFHVNTDKRTVVSLLRWRFDNSVVSKGIAKCDPDDVFNADIGKAIALARALGVEVPTEFVKAVQPTELISGMIYELGSDSAKFHADNTTHKYAFAVDADIKDDTDAVYS